MTDGGAVAGVTVERTFSARGDFGVSSPALVRRVS